MSLKNRVLFVIIKVQRFIFKKKFISIFGGPLKGYKWSTSFNYDYLTGDYEDQQTLDKFRSWTKPESVFYDLGANVGYYSFIANQFISLGTIYSFEPMPANISIFKEHLKLNASHIKYQNIELMPYAVSDSEKEVVFSNNEDSKEGNTYLDSVLHKASAKDLKVKCYSVDSLMEKGYKKPDILKIDVEGAELDVLKGARNTLQKYKPNILLATHDCHVPGIQKQCVDYLRELGYNMQLLPGHNKAFPGLDDYIAIHHESAVN